MDNASGSLDPSLYAKEMDTQEDAMQSALKVALLDHTLAIRRCLSLYRKADYLPIRAELVPRFEATFQHELTTLFPFRANLVDDISARSSFDKIDRPEISIQQPDANGGAAQSDPPETGRQSRRLSIGLFKRGSSRQGRSSAVEQENVNGNARGSSRAGSRTRGRERSSSRLSVFRNLSDQDGRKEGETPLGVLRKRLSFLGGTART
jgi:hypothetical protein